MAAGDELVAHVDVVARAEIVAAIEYGLGSGDISHESCPEIGEHDWNRIAERIREIIGELTPDDETRAASYSRLIARVGNG